MRITLVFLFVFFSACYTTVPKAPDVANSELFFEIKQFVSGSYEQHTYIFHKNRLIIVEKSIRTSGSIEEKVIYIDRHINPALRNSIVEKMQFLMSLKPEYKQIQLGGLTWVIYIILEGQGKKIKIENVTVKEINYFFEIVNSIIPRNMPKLHYS